MDNAEFLKALRKRKAALERRRKKVFESDIKLSETLTRKIEMINIMLSEFGRQNHPNSIKNLLHRSKF
jgi:hypothetical protein